MKLYLETLFPILILLEEIGSIDEHLSVRNLQAEDLIVYCFRGFDCTDRFFEIDIE